jgi:hypothetical protein
MNKKLKILKIVAKYVLVKSLLDLNVFHCGSGVRSNKENYTNGSPLVSTDFSKTSPRETTNKVINDLCICEFK